MSDKDVSDRQLYYWVRVRNIPCKKISFEFDLSVWAIYRRIKRYEKIGGNLAIKCRSTDTPPKIAKT